MSKFGDCLLKAGGKPFELASKHANGQGLFPRGRDMRFSWMIIAASCCAVSFPSALVSQTSDAPESQFEQKVLKHEVLLDVGIEEAWSYFTDAEKVRMWMAPVAQVELRPGGTIKTNYDKCASIGDAGTIELKIVNFIPGRFLTLQSDLEVAKEAEWMNETIFSQRKNLFNLIEFQPVGENQTRIVSWGLGYGTGGEWSAIMGFFDAGNQWSYGQLRKAISGETVWPSCDKR